jgi:hypothetical protein
LTSAMTNNRNQQPKPTAETNNRNQQPKPTAEGEQ